MKRVGVVLPHLLARAAINPGNVVTNPKYPNQGKFKSSSLDVSLESGSLLLTKIEDYDDVQKRDQGAGLSVVLSRILGSKLTSNADDGLTLSTKKVITYQLDNSNSTFKELCRDMDFQKWFEDAVKLSNVFFVVGLQTIADAEIDLHGEISLAGQVGLTVAASHPAATVEATVEGHGAKSRSTTFKAAGEQIYAVEYRKVVFDLIGRKDVSSASLSPKQSWKPYLTTRGDADADETLVCVQLADIEDNLDEEGDFKVLFEANNYILLFEEGD